MAGLPPARDPSRLPDGGRGCVVAFARGLGLGFHDGCARRFRANSPKALQFRRALYEARLYMMVRMCTARVQRRKGRWGVGWGWVI